MKKPFDTYNGGKSVSGTYQKIINHIPACNTFIDAMVGNGGVFLNLKLPALTIINDIDRSIIDRYDCDHATDINDCVGQPQIVKENIHVRQLIEKYDCDKRLGTFFYFDPPYLKSTRKSQKDLYRFEWTEQQHIDFLKSSSTVNSNCMISHYPCDLYDEYLKDWHTFDFQSTTRKGPATERIYMNYPKPTILQDFRYLGDDYIDRQRIKRKVNRFVNKLNGLPELERTAILSSIIDNNNYTAAQLFSSMSSGK